MQLFGFGSSWKFDDISQLCMSEICLLPIVIKYAGESDVARIVQYQLV